MADEPTRTEAVDEPTRTEAADEPAAVELKLPEHKLCLAVLRTVRDHRQLRGLRHTNYVRYRTFCNSRIKRIRRALRLTKSKSKSKAQAVVVDRSTSELALLTHAQMSDARILELQLLHAERAWARSMELREINASEHSLRIKIHIHRKLRKAVKHATVLTTFADRLGDARTSLEAHAYADVICALLDMEDKQWDEAFVRLARVKFIFAELVKHCPEPELAEVCESRSAEVELSLRSCRHNLGSDAVERLQAGAASSERIAHDLSDKIAALVAAQTQALQAAAAAAPEPEQPAVSTDLVQLAVERKVATATKLDLPSAADVYSFSFAERKHFVDRVPPFEPMPCKPQLFDLAISAIEFPNIEARTKPPKKSGWFGFW